MIGSEIDWASKKRKYRGAKKRAKGMTMSSNCLPNVRQEIDIELEKEGEIEKISPSFYGEYKNVSLTDEEYGKLKENSKSKVYTFEDYDKGEHL